MKSGDYIICSDFNMWKKIIHEELLCSSSFDIHCWNNETEIIKLALKFGAEKSFDWDLGQVITGSVTSEFIQFITGMKKPEEKELSGIFTPFFSIFLDTGFSSEHYGNELIKL